ncbi:GNAT family N-acetyltransferase [Purpureocillium lavendulum]|uniref:GNAT family N-acetyltransferase n=1 Tax=Purpureocillium lavendulum TaxID=1247861 RepID=A0AB34FTE7_9HYPO|nr:GNAT family N-acetyltransferase [Purpureocillium lavendulum]
MAAARLRSLTWTRGDYRISTDSSRIPVRDLQRFFAAPEFYWAEPLPDAAMRDALDNSLCFGLFRHHRHQHDHHEVDDAAARDADGGACVGVARCVTDFVTFLYVTDVWVEPALQGQGLGGWLTDCVQEVIESMPHLRRSMLFTGNWDKSVPFYRRRMGMEVMETREGTGLAIMVRNGRGHPSMLAGRKRQNGTD